MMKLRMPKMNRRNLVIAAAALVALYLINEHMMKKKAAPAAKAEAEAVKKAMAAPAPMAGMNM